MWKTSAVWEPGAGVRRCWPICMSKCRFQISNADPWPVLGNGKRFRSDFNLRHRYQCHRFVEIVKVIINRSPLVFHPYPVIQQLRKSSSSLNMYAINRTTLATDNDNNISTFEILLIEIFKYSLVYTVIYSFTDRLAHDYDHARWKAIMGSILRACLENVYSLFSWKHLNYYTWPQIILVLCVSFLIIFYRFVTLSHENIKISGIQCVRSIYLK